MEPFILISMLVFWVIIASIVGGVILLRPVFKKLGNYLEDSIAIRRMEAERRSPEVEVLAARLEALESAQSRLLEGMAFHEELTKGRDEG